MYCKIGVIFCLFVLFVCCTFVYSAEENAINPIDVQACLQNLGQLTETDRTAFLKTIMSDRRALQNKLLSYLTPETSKEVKFTAAFLLGYYRMDEAVDRLSNYITLLDESNVNEWNKLPLWGVYPAADALTRIGIRAVPRMITNVSTSEDPLVRSLSAKVIRDIHGSTVGKFVIENALTKANNELSTQRLNEALLIMK